MDSADSPHVALLAFPFGTHAAPLFTLASAIAAASPPAANFSFISTNTSNSSLARSNTGPVRNLRFIDIPDGYPPGYDSPNPTKKIELFMKNTPENYKTAMESAVEASGGLRVTCVVSDAFLWFVGEIAKDMGVPWVPLWTSGPCSLSAHLYTDLLRREIRVEEEDKQLDFIPGLSNLRAIDLPEGVILGDHNDFFPVFLRRMGYTLLTSATATAVAFNSFQGLHPAIDVDFTSKFKKPLLIGPLHLLSPSPPERDQLNCLLWLDRHKPSTVAYISFGTFVSLPPLELAELAFGLENCGVPFLWSLKETFIKQLPIEFLDHVKDRGLIVPWTPQIAVLEHMAVGVFLTHCGWNSVMESVTCGVPMVCKPALADQKMNARVVSHVWEVGLELERGVLKRDDVKNCLERVLMKEEGKRMKEKVGEIRQMAVEAVGESGSSRKNLRELSKIVIGR